MQVFDYTRLSAYPEPTFRITVESLNADAWMKPIGTVAVRDVAAAGHTQHIDVRVAYRLHEQPTLYQLDFVARITDAAQASADGLDLVACAMYAIHQHHQATAAAIGIAGVESY